ncbi:RNA-binding protein [Magnetospirillum aberrantis]|uniref:RNA-binding protein n=1 Tax=Magnetospirillum aberrantis SpK TaxID=908842 RepID=A0A7C9V195_9PROT|nr:RNA-binding protein [Magnetospirillum aberrantis]NFV81531.1 RNA-binding protein [Magnetospirillum aberrantis SpK]
MEDWAEADQPGGPQRRCIATGQVRPKEELLRFVVSPAGEVVPDLERRLPGRGIWLSARRDVVNTAVSKRLFAKAARRAVTVPDDLADRVGVLLGRRCLEVLSLARRAGQALCGFEKVKAELKAGRVAVLVEARDAAEDGKNKIRALASGVPVVELFDAVELGEPFGRDQSVHAALSQGGLARRLVVEAGLLAGFRQGLVSRPSSGAAPESV